MRSWRAAPVWCWTGITPSSATPSRQRVEQVARDAGVAFTGLWLVADQAVTLARVARRRGDASDATAAIVRRQAAYDLGDMRWEVIPASGDADETTAIARRQIAG